MAEEKTEVLQKMEAEVMEDYALPEGLKDDHPQSIQCKKIMAEMKIEHDKYEKIVKKIKTSINQLFLVKCNVNMGEYYFLAEYKYDGFKDFFGKNSAFGEFQVCLHDKVKINRNDEINRLNKLYGDGPSLGFKFLHNNKEVTIRI